MIQKTLTISLLLIGISGQAIAAGEDQFGIPLEYNQSYQGAGCSETAWKYNVAHYQSKVNEYNALSEKMNQGILEATVNPAKLSLNNCLGDVESMYSNTLSAMRQIYDQAKGFESPGFKAIASNLFNQVVEKLSSAACKAAQDKINSGLKASGIDKLTSEISSASKNPLGYVIDKSGAQTSLDFGNGVNLDFGSVVKSTNGGN